MTPPYDTDTDLDAILAAAPAEPARLQRLRQFLADLPRPTVWYGYLFLALFAVSAAGLLWLAVSTLIRLASAIAGAGDGLHGWLTAGPITRTITAPVHSYLDTHAAGLPATAGQLWTTWLAVTGVLFVTAVLGGRGARIGWTLLGVLSTAMVYAGTPSHGRYLTAGLTAAVWAVLSIPALRRTDTGPTVINQIRPAPADGSATNDDVS